MDVPLLRTMARKSIFDGGRLESYSVQQALDLKRYFILAYSYYNYSRISFLDDILDELLITGDLKIEKPGKCPEMYENWKKVFGNSLTDEQRMGIAQKGRKIGRIKARKIERYAVPSKSKQQSNNRYGKSNNRPSTCN